VRHIGITGLPLKIFRTVLDRHVLLTRFHCRCAQLQMVMPVPAPGCSRASWMLSCHTATTA
jgi:hypothetical protein